MTQTKQVLIRISEEQKAQFERAAKAAGKGLSEWFRDLGAREIAPPAPAATQNRIAESDHRSVPTEPRGPRMTAAELVRKIPGLSLGFGGAKGASGNLGGPSVAEDEPIDIGDAPVEDVASWLDKWTELRRMGESDPGSAHEEMQRLAPKFKPPRGFMQWPLRQQAAYLDEAFPLSE